SSPLLTPQPALQPVEQLPQPSRGQRWFSVPCWRPAMHFAPLATPNPGPPDRACPCSGHERRIPSAMAYSVGDTRPLLCTSCSPWHARAYWFEKAGTSAHCLRNARPALPCSCLTPRIAPPSISLQSLSSESP